AILDALLRDVIKEFALDTEWAPGELHFDLALLPDLVDVVLEQTDDVRGIARSSNSNNRAGVRDPVRSSERSSAAQAVADQNCGCPVGLTEMVARGNQIIDVGREMRIGKLALAHSESGKIETQNGNATHCQPFGNAFGRDVILAARETVREQCEGNWLAEWQIDKSGQFLAHLVGKFEPLGAHGVPFCRCICAWYDASSDIDRHTHRVACESAFDKAGRDWRRNCLFCDVKLDKGVSHDASRSHGKTSRYQARERMDLEIHLRADRRYVASHDHRRRPRTA